MGDRDSVRLPSEDNLASRKDSHASKSSATGSRHIESRDEGLGNSTTPSDWRASTRNDRSRIRSSTSGYSETITNAAEDIYWLCMEPEKSNKREMIINTLKLEKALQDLRKRIEDLANNRTSYLHISSHNKEEPESALGSLCSTPLEIDSANCERESLKSVSLQDYSYHENSDVATSVTDLNQESGFRSKDLITTNPSITVTDLNNRLKQESILSFGNSADAATNTMNPLKQALILSSQLKNSTGMATNSSITDLKQQASPLHPHSGTSDILISNPSTSTTDLKQESLQSITASDSISLESPIQETNRDEGSDCSNLIVFPSKTVPLDSLARISLLLTEVSKCSLTTCFENQPTVNRVSEILKDPPKVAFDRGSEITNSQNLLFIPNQQNNELNLVEQNNATGKQTLICYFNLAESFMHRSSQEINANKIILSLATCKMFSLNNKISLLIGKLSNNTWKLSFYSLHTESMTYKQVSNFSLSIPEPNFDFVNCIPVSHRDGRVIIASVLNDRIVFHIFYKSTSGKKWASAFSMLSQPQTKLKIQSCIIVSNKVYCSLVQEGVGARICQFNIRILQQHQKNSINVQPVCMWYIKDPNLKNCIISIHKEEVIIICCYNVNNKTVIEVKQLNSSPKMISPTLYRFKFPCIVNIFAVSVVPCSENFVIVVIYHDEEADKHFIKRIDMSSHDLQSVNSKSK